ncbi:hypothetical protein [Nocardioides dilutus]
MSEDKLTQFRERAAAGVRLPDLDALARRGAARRQRRIAATAVATVAAAGVIGFAVLQLPGDDRSDGSHLVDQPSEDASPGARALSDGVTLEPGIPAYDEFQLSTGGTVRVELATPAEGWFAHLGNPERGLNVGPDNDWTGLLWSEATGVYEQRCEDTSGAEERIVPMTDSLRPLLDKDWVTVVQQPSADTLGGREAQHAVLVVKACGGDLPAPLATGGVRGALPGGAEFDIWLVSLPEAETAMVVWDPTGDGSDAVRQQWDQVVDSLEITVEPAP